MPYPNEHSARLLNPNTQHVRVRRTKGGTIRGVKVPASVSVIWYIVMRSRKETPIPQALRFPTSSWTAEKAKNWLKTNKINYSSFEAASGESKESKPKNINNNDLMDLRSMVLFELSAGKIDAENKTIKNTKILSRFARNSESEIFREFSESALDDAITVFNGALARLDHQLDNPDDRGVNGAYGVYSNITKSGDDVFGDLLLWDCDDAIKVLSIAQRTPNAVGNSIHAGAIGHLDDSSGREIITALKDRTPSGTKSSVDLVEDPSTTMGIFNTVKVNETNKNEKGVKMEITDLTIDDLKNSRPDLVEAIKAETADVQASKDLKTENEKLKKEKDEMTVQIEQSKRRGLVEIAIKDSGLPDYAITEGFTDQLVAASVPKDGKFEDVIKEIIADRVTVVNGGQETDEEINEEINEDTKVRGNTEKTVTAGRGAGGKKGYTAEQLVSTIKS